MNASGITHDECDRPVASAEVILVAPVTRKRDDPDVNITLMESESSTLHSDRIETAYRLARMFTCW